MTVPSYEMQSMGRFKRLGSHKDVEEDAVGLVTVASRTAGVEPGKIMVNRAFEVP